jgi:hypothetical protein
MTVILGRWLGRHALLAAVEDMVPRNDSPPDRRREGTPATSSRAGLSLDSLAPLLEERSEDADEEVLELTAA